VLPLAAFFLAMVAPLVLAGACGRKARSRAVLTGRPFTVLNKPSTSPRSFHGSMCSNGFWWGSHPQLTEFATVALVALVYDMRATQGQARAQAHFHSRFLAPGRSVDLPLKADRVGGWGAFPQSLSGSRSSLRN